MRIKCVVITKVENLSTEKSVEYEVPKPKDLEELCAVLRSAVLMVKKLLDCEELTE